MTIAWTYLDKRTAAIDALKDYASMEYIVQTCPDNLDDARERMAAVPSSNLTGMPKQTNPHSGEVRLAASIDGIDILKERYRRALEYMEWFQPAWDALTDDERFVLSEFYQDGVGQQIDALVNICKQFHIERSSAYKKKNRALEKLATLLYGK